MAEIRYNAKVWHADSTIDKNVVFKANDFIIDEEGDLHVGNGETKFSELAKIANVTTLTVGMIPALGANKIDKLNGGAIHDEYEEEAIYDVDVIGKDDSLNEALQKLQLQVIALVDDFEGRIAELEEEADA